MIDLYEKVEQVFSLLHEYEPNEGYYLAFSGGKDSIVSYDLLKRSGVKFDAHYQFTSVDPPELVAFIKEHYSDVEIHKPEKTMFQLVEKNGFPSLWRRWCCSILKEVGGSGRIVITGIRSAESSKRSKRNQFETSKTDKSKRFLHIIFDWTDEEIWHYIRSLNMKYCVLYDEGWKRIGCIGCPMASKKEIKVQFERYPNYKKAYINSIQKCINKNPSKHFGKDAELFFAWWISRKSTKLFFAEKQQTLIEFIK